MPPARPNASRSPLPAMRAIHTGSPHRAVCKRSAANSSSRWPPPSARVVQGSHLWPTPVPRSNGVQRQPDPTRESRQAAARVLAATRTTVYTHRPRKQQQEQRKGSPNEATQDHRQAQPTGKRLSKAETPSYTPTRLDSAAPSEKPAATATPPWQKNTSPPPARNANNATHTCSTDRAAARRGWRRQPGGGSRRGRGGWAWRGARGGPARLRAYDAVGARWRGWGGVSTHAHPTSAPRAMGLTLQDLRTVPQCGSVLLDHSSLTQTKSRTRLL